jgi:predicted GIY-YIG superfamily endonuclease
MTSTIYLLHFSAAYHHARHYIGFTDDLEARLADHRSGQGARLMAVIKDAGLTFEIVRTWSGDRAFERKLKRRKNTPTLCPECAGGKAFLRARTTTNAKSLPVR